MESILLRARGEEEKRSLAVARRRGAYGSLEKALASREREKIPSLLSDRWLADSTLFGTAAEVREGVEAWYEAGVRRPMLVPSSAVGNQMKAFEELFAIF